MNPSRLTLLIFAWISCLSVNLSKIYINYTSFFSFGDSLSDTGNFKLSTNQTLAIDRLPYGMTYFHRPTGRSCDGRLVVDFVSEAMDLPLLAPYLEQGRNFSQGANFAVSGATALDPEFFQKRGMGSLLSTNISLKAQLEWFDELKPSLCHSVEECKEYFSKSLFLVGEIGINDYTIPLIFGKSIDEVFFYNFLVFFYVPEVVHAIKTSVERLINQGVIHLVVPGNLPMGCLPIFLTIFYTTNKAAYDPRNGCLNQLNSLAEYHNYLLQNSLKMLQLRYPQARIKYADYYSLVISFVDSPQQFGFSSGALRACCGGGGLYNFNSSVFCGSPEASVCADPPTYMNWDGIHLTEAAYNLIGIGIISGPYSRPPMFTNFRS